MTSFEILTLAIVCVCLLCLCVAFTYLFRHYFMTSINDINSGKEDVSLITDAVGEEQKKKSRARKAWRTIGRIISNLILVVVLLFFAYALYNRITGNMTSFFESSYVVIASGSMSERNEVNTYLDEYDLNNQIDTYDIIGISYYGSQEEVRLYDVIAYRGSTGDTIVHRIIDIDDQGHYQTRGDSNNASDTNVEYGDYLTYDDIIGYYNGFNIGGVGSIVIFFQDNAGIATVVALIYCYLTYEHYSGKYSDSIEERTKLLLDVLDYDLNDDPDVAITKDANECLIYKGERYIFEDGEFLEKESVSEEELEKIREERETPSSPTDKEPVEEDDLEQAEGSSSVSPPEETEVEPDEDEEESSSESEEGLKEENETDDFEESPEEDEEEEDDMDVYEDGSFSHEEESITDDEEESVNIEKAAEDDSRQQEEKHL